MFEGNISLIKSAISLDCLDEMPEYFKNKDYIHLSKKYESIEINIIHKNEKPYVQVGVSDSTLFIPLKQKRENYELGICTKEWIKLLWQEEELRLKLAKQYYKEDNLLKTSYWIAGFYPEANMKNVFNKDNVDFERHQNYILTGKKKELMDIYKQEALFGSVGAMTKLGTFYAPDDIFFLEELPRYKEKGESIFWYEMAAIRGSVFSMVKVAEFYDKGIDTYVDH
ncbi:MAG: hypothetical protein AAF847_01795 [Bacteroidota bacterium]